MGSVNKRIVFMGTPEFAVASLDALLRAGIDVAAVVTAPDRPAGRGRQLRMSAVKEYAIAHGLRVLQPVKLRDPSFHEELDSTGADLYIVVAFRMLPKEVWTRPPLGTINLHGSLLPAYRGAAPINWAIINGEQRTGATTFFIREEIDTGDMLDQVELRIGKDETAGEVHDRLKAAGAELLVRTVMRVLAGDGHRTPQPVGDVHLPKAPKLTTEGCRINWSLGSRRVHDFIRGLSPFPGAWSQLVRADGSRTHFKVLSSRLADEQASDAPGTLRAHEEALLIACGSGTIRAMEVQPEGKRRMSAADFLRGAGNLDNARLE